MDLPNVSLPKIGVSPIQFLKEVKIELGKVKWPTKKEVVKMTGVVLAVSIMVGLLLSALDLVFTNLFSLIIK